MGRWSRAAVSCVLVTLLGLWLLHCVQADGRTVSVTLGASGVDRDVGEFSELKLYLRDERLVLSDFMPILENMGLRVIAVTPYAVVGDESVDATLYAFQVQDASGGPLEAGDRTSLMANTIMAVRAGDATNDRLNALVLSVGLAWRQVDVLRAYAAYGFQVGAAPSRLAIPGALVAHPEIARALFTLFEARFDPPAYASMEERGAEVKRLHREIADRLNDVESLSEDRALRRMRSLIMATVRTNYFRNGGATPTRTSGGVPYVSLKFSMQDLTDIARTRLLYEVWVRSSRMEGVHLRGAKVARGDAHLVHQAQMHAPAQVGRRRVGDEDAARLPDMVRHRRLAVKQIRGDRVQKPPLGVADHVGVDAAPRRGGRQPDAGQHRARAVVHGDPARGRRVVLIVLHAEGLRQVPLVLDDEGIAPCAKEVGEQLAMVVKVLERKGRRFHGHSPALLGGGG